eukprot:gene25185-10822_t
MLHAAGNIFAWREARLRKHMAGSKDALKLCDADLEFHRNIGERDACPGHVKIYKIADAAKQRMGLDAERCYEKERMVEEHKACGKQDKQGRGVKRSRSISEESIPSAGRSKITKLFSCLSPKTTMNAVLPNMKEVLSNLATTFSSFGSVTFADMIFGLQAAEVLLNDHVDLVEELAHGEAKGYTLKFVGHSLGAGVAALMALMIVNKPELKDRLEIYAWADTLKFVGHSLGADVAALMALMIVNKPELKDRLVGEDAACAVVATCFACPAVTDSHLSESLRGVVTSVVMDQDIVPRISCKTMAGLVSELSKLRPDWVQGAQTYLDDSRISQDMLALVEKGAQTYLDDSRISQDMLALVEKGAQTYLDDSRIYQDLLALVEKVSNWTFPDLPSLPQLLANIQVSNWTFPDLPSLPQLLANIQVPEALRKPLYSGDVNVSKWTFPDPPSLPQLLANIQVPEALRKPLYSGDVSNWTFPDLPSLPQLLANIQVPEALRKPLNSGDVNVSKWTFPDLPSLPQLLANIQVPEGLRKPLSPGDVNMAPTKPVSLGKLQEALQPLHEVAKSLMSSDLVQRWTMSFSGEAEKKEGGPSPGGSGAGEAGNIAAGSAEAAASQPPPGGSGVGGAGNAAEGLAVAAATQPPSGDCKGEGVNVGGVNVGGVSVGGVNTGGANVGGAEVAGQGEDGQSALAVAVGGDGSLAVSVVTPSKEGSQGEGGGDKLGRTMSNGQAVLARLSSLRLPSRGGEAWAGGGAQAGWMESLGEDGGKEGIRRGARRTGVRRQGEGQRGGKEEGGKKEGGKEDRGKEGGGKEVGGKKEGGKEDRGKEGGGKEGEGKNEGGKKEGGKEDAEGAYVGSPREVEEAAERAACANIEMAPPGRLLFFYRASPDCPLEMTCPTGVGDEAEGGEGQGKGAGDGAGDREVEEGGGGEGEGRGAGKGAEGGEGEGKGLGAGDAVRGQAKAAVEGLKKLFHLYEFNPSHLRAKIVLGPRALKDHKLGSYRRGLQAIASGKDVDADIESENETGIDDEDC